MLRAKVSLLVQISHTDHICAKLLKTIAHKKVLNEETNQERVCVCIAPYKFI